MTEISWTIEEGEEWGNQLLCTRHPETRKDRFYGEVTHLARVPRLPV